MIIFVPAMLDSFLLFPYWLALKWRHRRYDSGKLKAVRAEVPTICVGNITVGGTGKTPHVELILRMLLNSDEWAMRNIAVLSRGYKRKSDGFRNVEISGSALLCGDEPVQIKKKFPVVHVAVDADRVDGCRRLCHPQSEDARPADIIVLDDAFQYRALRADLNILLVDYNRPVHSDMLLPLGRLRDLRERLWEADVIVVTKCRETLDETEKEEFAAQMGLLDYDCYDHLATTPTGKRIWVYFSYICYEPCEPMFEESNPRFIYSKKAVLVTGIARNSMLCAHLGARYELLRSFDFPDHHRFTKRDFRRIMSVVKHHPTAAVLTTEKDAQRILDAADVPQMLRERMFYLPIRAEFVTPSERSSFRSRIVRP